MEQRNSSIEIYRSPEGNIELNVKLENDTVWLTQSQMAELFAVDRTSVTRHIRNIYKSQELDEKSTCAKNAQVRFEGKRQIVRDIPYYNLDMIISVGYRVNSKNATSFRRWATSILKQYIIKGYAINQKRLDNYNELKEVVRLMSRAITLQDQVRKNVYLCRQNEENGHIISIFPVADLRCRLYSIALSPVVRRNRRYG